MHRATPIVRRVALLDWERGGSGRFRLLASKPRKTWREQATGQAPTSRWGRRYSVSANGQRPTANGQVETASGGVAFARIRRSFANASSSPTNLSFAISAFKPPFHQLSRLWDWEPADKIGTLKDASP